MKYDFDTIIPRRGTNSYKWDTPEEENVLPMWVADMDFRTAPTIVEALQRRVAHGIFGYTKVPRNLLRCSRPVVENRHRWRIDPPVDYLYKRCRTGSVGHYQSPDRTGRQGNRPDSGIQLLLFVDSQRRMRTVGQ